MILGLVCARKGSEGVPGKNLLELGGFTLLERAIAKAIMSQHIEVVFVSTDIDYAEMQIQVAERGSEKPVIWQDRPSHLAGPAISKWPVYQHCVHTGERVFEPVEFMVDIDVSRPLTTARDIDATIHAYMQSDRPALLAVSRAKKNPWQDTYITDPDWTIRPALDGGAKARQGQPAAWEHGGILCVDREALFQVDDLWELKVDSHEIQRSHTFDIDDELDYVIARAVHGEGAYV